MKRLLAILTLVLGAGCTASPRTEQHSPTHADVRAVLPSSYADCRIEEIRQAADGTFIVSFGSADMTPRTFEEGKMIRPPVKLVWTNDQWEVRSIFDHRNPGNRKRTANNQIQDIGTRADL